MAPRVPTPDPKHPDTWTPQQKQKARERALRLHSAGMSRLEIAEQTGIPYARVKDDIQQAMRDLADEPVEYAAMSQIATLRDLRRTLYAASLRGEGQAIDRLMRVMDHEAKLLGLYAPQRVHAVVGGGVSDAEFALIAEAMLRGAGKSVPRHIEAGAHDAKQRGVAIPELTALRVHEAAQTVEGEIVDER